MSSEKKSEAIRSNAGNESYDDFIEYEGFWHSPRILERIKAVQKEFKADDSDIILCSFPKSGTTWLKALTFAIMFRRAAEAKGIDNWDPTVTTTITTSSSNDDDSTLTPTPAAATPTNTLENPLLALNPHQCIKFLESTPDTRSLNLHPSLSPFMKHLGRRRLLATHIPYTSLPSSVAESGCKIVYICRDPKDVVVSLWNFGQGAFQHFQGIVFQDMFDKFCQGKEKWSPIWDHVLGFWKAASASERHDKVLFLKYEDLKSQTSYYVKKLADFLGEPFSIEEEQNGEVEKIIQLCSLENLSSLEANKNGTFSSMGDPLGYNKFFRKGQVGDWKNYLSEEMKGKLDNIIQDKFNGTGLNVIAT